MSLVEQIQKDITAAMKAREEQRLSTLRMVKSALQNRQIEKMAPLDDKESQAVLTTLIKQRKESVEQFTKGGRQEMADKEAAEIVTDRNLFTESDRRGRSGRRSESRDRRDGRSHHERHGHGDEEGNGPLLRRRHARGWEDGQRGSEAGVGGK